ncbi:Anthranilate synthase component I, N terminal region family protein [Candida albicans]|uniref:Anthranilate synthase component I, N terminal region family protein n=1 Tax=Candida albicans TaxID=5476 RepID=A0A8H6C3I3_CANAX|nr:Anthranilate synthase component I, N terminal region family protein [Candida albicans]
MQSQLVQPTIETLKKTIDANSSLKESPNVYPVYKYVPYNDITIHQAYLKLANLNDSNRTESFLFESSVKGDTQFADEFCNVDPITVLEKELSKYKQAPLPGLPKFNGGATGYISYDCIKYFEPKTKRPMKDVLGLPEAVLMFCDLVVAFDHVYQRFQIIYNIKIDDNRDKINEDIESLYKQATENIEKVEKVLLRNTSSEEIAPKQGPIKLGQNFISNIGQEGYEKHVTI